MERICKKIVVTVLCLFSLTARSQGPTVAPLANPPLGGAPILTYQQWKTNQLLEAQNRTARLSNRLTIMKSQSSGPESEINSLESELRSASQNLEVIRDLTIEDYVLVYVSNYNSNNKALETAAQGLSEAEVTELLRLLLKAHANKDGFSSNSSVRESKNQFSTTLTGRSGPL